MSHCFASTPNLSLVKVWWRRRWRKRSIHAGINGKQICQYIAFEKDARANMRTDRDILDGKLTTRPLDLKRLL